MKAAFKTIADRINNQVSEVQHLDLWNNQIESLEEEKPFDYPAVFLEFEIPDFTNVSRSSQQAEGAIIRLYVADWKYEDSYEGSPNQAGFLAYFDLLDKLHAALHGWSDPDGTFSALQRRSINPDNNHGGVVVYTIDFETTLFDAGADETLGYQQVNPGLGVNNGINRGSGPGTPFIVNP